MSEGDTVPALLAAIDAEQRRLREGLAGRDEGAMARRPPSGKWSVLENVRHLLFAEQAHLGGFVPGGRDWSAVGFTPQTMLESKKLAPIGSAPLPTVPDVLAAWSTIHASTAAALAGLDSGQVRAALSKNLRHLHAHVEIVERLLRTAARPSP